MADSIHIRPEDLHVINEQEELVLSLFSDAEHAVLVQVVKPLYDAAGNRVKGRMDVGPVYEKVGYDTFVVSNKRAIPQSNRTHKVVKHAVGDGFMLLYVLR